MGFWDRFKEKQKKRKDKKPKRERYWWEDEERYYQGKYSYDESGSLTGWDGGGYSYRGGYTGSEYSGYSYNYTPVAIKRTYDLSVSLEARISSLVQTITGQKKRVVVANGWGIDDEYIYFNPNDISETASDDEVLGRILHQVAIGKYRESRKLAAECKNQAPYRHLLVALEQWRNDRALWDYYPGCKYYAKAFWQEAGKENYRPKPVRNDKGQVKVSKSQEFIYAADCSANEDAVFEFADKKLLAKFEKALPHIEDYILEGDFKEALKHFEQIKKYYPLPDENEQQGMDSQMAGNMITSEGRKQARAVDRKENGSPQEGKEKSEGGKLGGFSDGKPNDDERDRSWYWHYYYQHLNTINALHKLLQSIISDNEATRYIRPFRRGKLDKKRIYKFVATGNMRVFKQKREFDKKKYGMMIVVDQSGSMDGPRADYAMRTALVLTEVFNRLNLPFSLVGFSDDNFVYKRFNQSIPRDTILNLRRAYNGTNDLGALQFANNELDKVYRNQRTGIFVITDGCGRSPVHMKSEIEKIEQKNARVFGLGIGGVDKEDIDRSYTKGLAVENIEQLPRELATLLTGQFKRV